MVDEPVSEFNLRVAFEERRATVSVSGEIDLISAPCLAGMLTAVVGETYPQVVVDLSAVTFMDARGVDVLARVAERAASVGATLILRSTPAGARRILDVTRVSPLLVYEAVAKLHKGVETNDAERGSPPATDHAAHDVSQNALVRSSTDVIDAALRLVTALAGATVDNADGVSVTLERRGRLMTVAATDDAVLTMDQHQYDTGEGPCLDAKAEGRWFNVESLTDESRWPNFVPLALEQGIHSILSSPLRTRDRPQGALNIYSSRERAFGEHEQELAALFAAQASEILTTADEGVTDEESNERFTASLAARQTIHQAQGILMARDHLSANEAIRAVIHDARANDSTVLSQARDIIGSLSSDDDAD